jgi:RHS repeat-associated protein
MIDQTGLMASTRGGGLSIHPTAIDQQCVGWVRIVNPPSNNAEMVKRRMLDHTELMASTRDVVLSSHPTAVRIALRADEAIAWLLSDHLGSTSVTVDPSGNLMSALKYTAYGELRTGTSTTDYQYTGQRNEAEIGLYFYVARFYDPQLARFISADTIVPEPNSIKGYDRYAYVNGNPVNYTDPSGHQLCDTADGSCTGGGGGNGIEHPEPQVIYWGGYTEARLASFQETQTGNNCALNAISAGFKLLGSPLPISGNDLGEITSKMGILYRLGSLGGTMPFQQVNVINNIAALTDRGNLSITGYLDRTTDLSLATMNLSNKKMVSLITIYWMKNQGAPAISNSSNYSANNSKYLINGHTMVYVAYDPDHRDANGEITSYGFLNSWEANPYNTLSTISWMSANELEKYKYVFVVMEGD